MKQRVVRYKTKPESTETNARLIEQVFKELHAGPQKNLRYLVYSGLPLRNLCA